MFRTVAPTPLFGAAPPTGCAQRPTSVFFGWAALLAVALLVAGTLMACASRVAGALLDAALVVVNTYQVVRLGYLVFGTRGLGHYSLTPWRIIDSLLCNALAHVAVANALWKLDPSALVGPAFAGGFVSPWRALYEAFVYAVVFYAGGGVTDTLPAGALRLVTALEWLWQSVASFVLFAASVAVVQNHTDEDAKT